MALNRNIAPNAPNLGLSRVVADRRTFQPISSTFQHSLLGTVQGEYTPKQVTVRSRGVDGKESVKKLDLDGVYYDNEQGWQAFRLLPLTDNYKGPLPICSTVGAGPMKLETEVTGKETIEVPVGKFECYKLLVKPVQQTFWISADAHRYAVKFEAGGIIGVLQSIRQVKPGETVGYDDPKLGFSLSTPADWYVIPDKTAAKESESVVSLSQQAVSARPLGSGATVTPVPPGAKLSPDAALHSAEGWSIPCWTRSTSRSRRPASTCNWWPRRILASAA